LVSKATAWKQVELAKCTTRYFNSNTMFAWWWDQVHNWEN
jgi:hypothetical protein